MKISERAYELVRNKYLGMGEIVSDESCTTFRETIVKTKEGKVITIDEDAGDDIFNCEVLYIRIFIDEDLIEEYEVRI